MRYTVAWRRAALNQLATIWMDALDRQAVTDAANALDALLRTDAHLVGESRSGNTRVLFETPLVVLFDVFELDRRVEVISVRQAP
jgi:plasmid stabilization system protein ParE